MSKARILAVLVLLLAAAASARAGGVVYRPPVTAGVALNKDERAVLAAVNRDRAKHRLPPLLAEATLSRLARAHSEDMKAARFFSYTSPTKGPLRYQLHRAGVSTPATRFQIYRLPGLDDVVLRMYKSERPLHLDEGEHVGIGIVSTLFPRAHHITIVLARTHAFLEPFPGEVNPGEAYALKGTLRKGLAEPVVSIRPPEGDVYTLPVVTAPARGFSARVRFDRGKGEYIVEVLATGKLGPTVCSLMKVYAGTPYPPPEDEEEAERVTSVRAAEREMFRLLNDDRRKHAREVLAYDDGLADVARGHSRDMVERGFFGHISPKNGTLGDRMKRAGVSMRLFAENIAIDSSVRRAQESLMESPEHRRNILSRGVERVGIGIVVDKEGQIYVTQNFGTPHAEVEPAKASAALAEELNRARAGHAQTALARNATLDMIARENSKAMADAGKLGMERASKLLKRRLRGGRTYTLVVASGDAPKLEYFRMPPAEKLAGFRSVGIGIAGKKEATSGAPRWWTTVILLGDRN